MVWCKCRLSGSIFSASILLGTKFDMVNVFCRTILLGNGIEKLIRKAKMNYKSCKNAATDALRDLGLDNYNL